MEQLIKELEIADAGHRFKLTFKDSMTRALFGSAATFEDHGKVSDALDGSLDAAIDLVERVLPSWGWYWQPLADGTIYMGVTPKSRQHVPAAGAWSNHPSVCVALCIALLRALRAKEAGQ